MGKVGLRLRFSFLVVVLLFIIFVLRMVTLLEDLELAGANESTGVDAAEANEGAFKAFRSLKRDVIVVKASNTDFVPSIGSEFTKLAKTVVSGESLRVRVVDLNGDAVGTCALDMSGNASGLKLTSIGKLLVE